MLLVSELINIYRNTMWTSLYGYFYLWYIVWLVLKICSWYKDVEYNK